MSDNTGCYNGCRVRNTNLCSADKYGDFLQWIRRHPDAKASDVAGTYAVDKTKAWEWLKKVRQQQ
jgi:hypothetical protein